MDQVFHALSDATRRQMLQALSLGTKTVGDLAEPFAMSLPAASKHIRVLETAGLLRREVRWRSHWCALVADPLAEAHGWLAQYQPFWSARLDQLEARLRAESAGKPPETGEKP